MGEILGQRGQGEVISEVIKVKAHVTRCQARAAGQESLYDGNDKADWEAGKAVGAVAESDQRIISSVSTVTSAFFARYARSFANRSGINRSAQSGKKRLS